MLKDFLNKNLSVKSQANYVEYGYGQVEPNHLSAQRTGQIFAQLPAKSTINMLEQGQFVKYDYAAANSNGIGEVNFTGAGEWMLVYNEIKLYHDRPDGSKQADCEFAMFKGDYQAYYYAPYDWENVEKEKQSRFYNGVDANGATGITLPADKYAKTEDQSITASKTYYTYANDVYTAVASPVVADIDNYYEKVSVTYNFADVTSDHEDIYNPSFTNDPFHFLGRKHEKAMAPGTSMVPRVFKTNVGDIFTTNTINVAAAGAVPTAAEIAALTVGTVLTPNASNGILRPVTGGDTGNIMKWQVARVYTMPDGQRGVKIVRIA